MIKLISSPIVRWKRRREAWRAGVVHATLDPRGPGVARLHLVPPKPTLWQQPPHILMINGWHVLPMGHSWAALLRTFIQVLNEKARPDVELSPTELDELLEEVVRRMRQLYLSVSEDQLVADLSELVGIVQAVAKGDPVPELASELAIYDYAQHMAAPHRMDLVVAPMTLGNLWACPLRCGICYAAGPRQEAMNVEKELSTQEWKRIIDRCREAGIPQLNFTGGEPLTRPDIVELVEHAKWHVTRINTSGVLLTEELAAALAEASLDGIQITLYSHDPQVHDALVNTKGAWAKSVAAVARALKAGLFVSINTPLTPANADFATALRFFHQLGVRTITCSGTIPAGAGAIRTRREEVLTQAHLYDSLWEAIAVCGELEMELSFTSPGCLSRQQLANLGLSSPICGACMVNMAVAPNGAVVPCQSWLSDAAGLGRMLDTPWKQIWNSKKCRQIRQRAAASEGCPLKEEM